MFNLGRPGGVPLKLEFDVLLSHKAKYFVAVAVLALMLPAAGAQLSRMKLSDLKRMRADNMNFVEFSLVGGADHLDRRLMLAPFFGQRPLRSFRF